MSIVDSIKGFFSKKKDDDMSDKPPTIENAPQPKRKHKLEIQVFEADYERADSNNGQPQWRPVRSDPALDGGRPNIIEVADKKEFMEIQRQYALCDQKIKVIREIDPFVDEPSSSKSTEIPQNNRAVPVQSTSTVESSPAQQSINIPSNAARVQTVDIPVEVSVVKHKPKPKIVTIGDIEVKYDGDKVYQKQWMKLTPAEASNFRVVNDSNNKIVSMSGKRLEAKRWVLVEEKNDADNDDAVDNLIGE